MIARVALFSLCFVGLGCGDDSKSGTGGPAPQCASGVDNIKLEGSLASSPVTVSGSLGNRAFVNLGNAYFDLAFGSGSQMTLTWTGTVADGASISLTGKTIRFGGDAPPAVSNKLYCIRAGSLDKSANGGTFHLDKLEEAGDSTCFQVGQSVAGSLAGCWEQKPH